ncbi:MAG: hypothetical protein IKB78_06685 [Clostridia bacterium]|nr:hypothetical protein [Clostridia bacterium]
MKRLLISLMVFLCLYGLACAEEVDASALQLMQAKHPGYTLLNADQCGYTAAAVLGQGEERVLCVAEKVDGAWVLTIDNEKALPRGAEVSLLLDTDDALFWSMIVEEVNFTKAWHYSCFREDGVWGQVNCTWYSDGSEQGYSEYTYHWENGALRKIEEHRDENENLLERWESAAVSANWMEEYLVLEHYDNSLVPVPDLFHNGYSWLEEADLIRSAREIVPEYTYVDGGATEDGLELIMRDKEGVLRLITSACINGENVTNISSPLPEDARYAVDNFGDCVYIPGRAAALVEPCMDGVWRISETWPDGYLGDFLHLGRNWISEFPFFSMGPFYVGDNPWSDITTADWSTLPATMEEALEQLDPSRWAVVNNPNPADRLHLWEKADRESRSFAKYYNGTPVEVLEKGKTWTRVRIQGIDGWMMTQYLAFGKDAWQVKHALPCMFLLEEESVFPVWTEDNVIRGRKLTADGDWTVEKSEHVCIIGILGEEWYHVWFPDLDEGGMMRQSDFWPGNG